MRIAVVVTDFPKVTETFILRDLVEFHKNGHQVRIYHLTNFRKNEILHEFAKETISWAFSQPYLLGPNVIKALIRNIFVNPKIILKIFFQLITSLFREPVLLGKSLFIFPKSLAFTEDMRRWGADHIHAEFAGHPATMAWIASRLSKIPYSVSCHAHDIFLSQSLLDVKLGEAAFIRTISSYNRDFLISKIPKLRNSDFKLIRVSVDTSLIVPTPIPSQPTFNILFIGALEKRKGVEYLLKALYEVKDDLKKWHCKIIGGGIEDGRLKKIAKSLHIDDNVSFYGARSFEEISDAMKKTNVLVVPSIVDSSGRTEGLPTVIIEALAYQRPVIASDVTGVHELIKNNETGILVEPENIKAIGSGLIKIKKNPDFARKIAFNGRKVIEEEFDIKRNVLAQLTAFNVTVINQKFTNLGVKIKKL